MSDDCCKYVKVGDQLMEREDFDKLPGEAVARVRGKVELFDRIRSLIKDEAAEVGAGALINALAWWILSTSNSVEDADRLFRSHVNDLYDHICSNLLLMESEEEKQH